ncbi:MAG TPA: hypothetical protein V6C69_21330 [Trichormus sp.]|jgi:hypothetical protein
MNHEQITNEAHNLEKKLLSDPSALARKDSGFCQELEKAKREMSPKEYAELCKTMQKELPEEEKKIHDRAPNHGLPTMTLDMNADGTVNGIKFSEQDFGGEMIHNITLNGKSDHVQSKDGTIGLQEASVPIGPDNPIEVQIIQSALKMLKGTEWYKHHHHDSSGRPTG